MDKNCNLYKAIEESIIRPQSDKMKNLENVPHEFSEEYNKKIEETSLIACEKNTLPKTTKSRKKISVRTFSVIVAAAVLAGAVTVTASDSVRHMIYRLFNDSEDKTTFSSQIECTETPVFTKPSFTTPVTSEIPAVSVTTVLPASSTATSTTSVTTVTPASTMSGEYHPLTEATTQHIPVYHGINAHQQPSMMAPSYPTVVSTAPAGSENPQTTTVISNVMGEGNVTQSVTTVLTEEDSDITTHSTINYIGDVTSIVCVTSVECATTVEVVVTTEQPAHSIPASPSLTDDTSGSESDTIESTEQIQETTSDLTYTTTIKLK